MNWKITEEKKKLGEFMAQKATVAFGGKIWEAWFTTEIPISEGPYKFHGLPGLIIEMSDESQSHVYKLISVSKKSDFYDIMNQYDYQNTVKLNVEKYNKMQIEYRKNPMASFMQKIAAGDIFFAVKKIKEIR